MIKRVITTCNVLKKYMYKNIDINLNTQVVECGYSEDFLPPVEDWRDYPIGSRIQGEDSHYWFKLSFKTPAANKHQQLALMSYTGHEGERDTINPQGMVYVNGKLVQAFDTNHPYLFLEPETDYVIHNYFYMASIKESIDYKMQLVAIDIDTQQLYYDISVPLQACQDVYIENSYEYAATLKELERACYLLELNYPYTDEYYASIAKAKEFLKVEYYEKLCGNSNVTVNCIGHTHIDVAWLWTLAQTKEKVQRSFSTVIELMKRYPEYRFMMSQPQLYKYLSEVNPEMFAQVKELVRQGRWEIEGAMWLEADCNLINGESMVRQILHGKRYLKKEFDIDSKVLWLPDVFGYSAAIPQILKKSGITHFVTSKISWNDQNVLPYDTFYWQGIDGSEIITDFLTTQDYVREGNFVNETTYVSTMTPSMTAGTWNRYQQKAYNDSVMMVYGWGDGGGGPTEEMFEMQRRLSYGLPGLPKTQMTSLKEHLAIAETNFEKSCKEIGRTPKWVGELYLEFHRGTYTSMAKNKLYNRKSEMLMQSLEGLGTIAAVITGKEFYKDTLYSMWDTILLNQFHDIIPGSSIKEVYIDSHRQYQEVFEKGKELKVNALSLIADSVSAEKGILIYNPLGFERSDIIEKDGRIYETGNISPYGWKVITLKDTENKVFVNGNTVENDYYVLTIDNAGRISYLLDKANNREVFVDGAFGKEIQIFEDIPYDYENWEISKYYKEKCKILDCDAEISVIDEGCRKGFKIVQRYHDSVLTQYVYLYNNIKRIDVKNEFDWHETRQLVKIAFPLNVYTNKATYEIQYGNVERNTHSNTSWDSAKFEVCGHKWIDMSECGYGVSLLNDCKYGFSTEENVLKLTAIKCGIYPNEEADQCLHEFTYSIYPHKDDYRKGNTVKEAYSLNQPFEFIELKSKGSGLLPEEFSFVKTDSDNVIIETVKQCEDENSVIVRIYDAFGCRSNATVCFGIPVKKAELCDLMENSEKQLTVIDNSVTVPLKNFEILTLKITL